MSRISELKKALAAALGGGAKADAPAEKSQLTEDLEEALCSTKAPWLGDSPTVSEEYGEVEPLPVDQNLPPLVITEEIDEQEEDPLARTRQGMPPANTAPIPPKLRPKGE